MRNLEEKSSQYKCIGIVDLWLSQPVCLSDTLFDEVNWKQQVKVRYRRGISWWHMNRSGWRPIKRWVIHWLWWEDTEPQICNCSHLRSALYCIYDVKYNVIDETQHRRLDQCLAVKGTVFKSAKSALCQTTG